VTWRGWGACAAVLRGGDVAAFAALLAASGASDVALVGGIVDGIGGRDVALLVGSLGAGRIDKLAPVWPRCGH